MLRRFWPYGRLTHAPQGITVVLMGFLPIFAIVSMFPAIPSLIGHFAGNPNAGWEVPLMVSAPGLSIALLSPVAGLLADKVGRRTSLLWATLAYGVLGTIPVFLHSLSIIFASRLTLGISEAFILTGVNAPDRRLLGRPRAPCMAFDSRHDRPVPGCRRHTDIRLGHEDHVERRLPDLSRRISDLPGGAYFPVRAEAGWRDRRRAHPRGDAPPFPWPAVALTGAVTFLMSILYYVFIINGGLLFKEAGIVSSDTLSQLTALPSLCVIAGAYIFWMMRNTANAIQLAVSFLTLGAGLALMGAIADYRFGLVALTIQQAGAGMSVPALIAWTQTKLPFEHRGRGMGAWSTCFFLGQFSSPWIVHQLSNATGSMHGAFICAGLLGLAGAGVALVAAERGGSKRLSTT